MTHTIGIYKLWLKASGGGDKKAAVLAEHFSRNHTVWLITGEEPDKAALESYFGVDLSRVRVFVVRRPVLNALRSAARCLPRFVRQTTNSEMKLDSLDRLAEPALYDQIKSLGLDVLINCQWASSLVCPAPLGFYMCMFPHPMKGMSAGNGARAASIPSMPPLSLERLSSRLLGMSRAVLDSYTAITANSSFTSDWIRRRWGVSAEVVYSSCEPMGPPAAKEKWIMNVGRFVGPGRPDDKHQATMLEAFRKLKGLHAGGWQMHFAGTIPQDVRARKRTGEVVEAARGLPVVFHFNASLTELRELYRRSAIYWHATGYGYSPETSPAAQEHFGQTTVEAMSAGAVPVVINTGGQRDTVIHAENGFLWDDLDALARYTEQLAGDEELWSRLSRNAIQSSARFSREAFGSRIEKLICEAEQRIPSSMLKRESNETAP